MIKEVEAVSNILYIFITSMFTSNVCVGTGFAVPSLLAYKRSFAYTAILSAVFAFNLILSGVVYFLIYNYVLLTTATEFLSLFIMVLFAGIFSFVAYFFIKAVNKQAFYVYEKSYTFLLMMVSVLGILISTTANQTFSNYFFTLLFSAIGFLFINFFIYGAYFKINGTYAPKYLKGLPLMLITLSVIGVAFSIFGLLL